MEKCNKRRIKSNMGKVTPPNYSKWLIPFILVQCASANNKYCAFEVDGEAKYYICPRNENCCSLGCCVNLAFQFYQLWYYWLLVIFMFMVCSGGGWWYRFCRSSRNISATPAISSRQHHSHHHHQNPSMGISSTSNLRANRLHYHPERHCHHHHHHHGHQQQQRARILHRPCGQHNNNSVCHWQRIWKTEPNVIQPQQFPPSYSTMFLNLLTNTCSSNATTPATDSTGVREGSGSTQPMGCPYYQLNGPPPSYDSVIQLTSNGGVMTSCLVAAPSSPIITVDPQDVTDNHNHGVDGEEIIQEIVISEPRRWQQPLQVSPSGTALGECRITRAADNENEVGEEEDEVEAAVEDAETPLISVKCSSQSTQLERSNTTNCEGFVGATTSPASNLAGSRKSTATRTLHSSSSVASLRDFEEVPSTSSSSSSSS